MTRRINKPIRYEKHALQRMLQRGITQQQIERALSDPHSRSPAKRPGATKIRHLMNARETLTVIIEETPSFIRVVSAWVCT